MTDSHSAHISIAAKEIPICQQFPEKHLPCLLLVTEEIDYAPGQVIVVAREPASAVIVITRGIARAVLTSPRQTQLAAVVNMPGSGDLYGLPQALDRKPDLRA